MRLFGVILLAGLLSAVAAFAVTVAGIQIFACRSDAAGCGMAMAYQVLIVPVYAIVAMVAFGIAFTNRLLAIAVTAAALVCLTVLLFVFGLASDVSSGRQTQASDVADLLQLLVPFWAAVAVQWFVIRFYLQRRLAGAAA